uniref:Thioredoxin domain-containing protein n=1 Tax=Hyaloperonospora arabidopsidis (strain Emoy2) TaxID=559515 RepID=M4BVH1_HYAAE
MQLALATLVLFALAFTYEFVSMTTSLRSTEDMEVEKSSTMVHNRLHGHSVVYLQGFDDGYKFVTEYNVKKQGPLYIFVMSDVDRRGKYWCPDCERAQKPVMDAFNRSPQGSTLVEIRVGPPAYWKDSMNDFRQNELFYLDHIPTLMRYERGGNSSTMLTESFCTDTALLDYTFRVDQPLAGEANTNKVLTMSSSIDVIDYLKLYDNSYPLFLYFISGYHEFNGRLWCLYCDQADVAIMHYYNYTAPDDAVMVRVIVADTYEQWKQETNPFKLPEFQEKVASMREVPFLGFVTKDVLANKVQVHQFISDYKETERLKTFFKNEPRTARPKGE